MAETLVALGASPLALHSQSSLLLPRLRPVSRAPATTVAPLLPRLTLTAAAPSQRVSFQKTVVSARAVTTSAPPSSSPASTIVNDNVDFSTEGIEVGIEPDNGGGGGFGDIGSGGGGGGGGGDGDKGPEEDSGGDEGKKKKMGLSMSQKLTLGYAALVGIGGLMGFLKSGSQKSLLSGGISALSLYYVHTQLPTYPVYASSIGLGISAALLCVMGTRFMKSGKIFPAGVVSLVSFIMTGGYIHGIFRSVH